MSEDEWCVTGSLGARVCEQKGVAEFFLSGEFDLAGAAEVEQQLAKISQAHSRLVVDLSAVTFMDSSALGVLARTKHLCDDREAQLVVRMGDSPARRVLDLAGLNEYLGVTE